jgi:hypothetical protein
MFTVIEYDEPVDLVGNGEHGCYCINIYSSEGKFVKARRYEGVSGNYMMDLSLFLQGQGYKTEW